MSTPERYKTNPMVSCGEEDDGAVLFNPDTDDTALVNLTGRTLWAFLEDTPRSLDEMAAHLVETYKGVSAGQATEDSAQFVQALMPDYVTEIDDDG
ncbi:PqqD family peptide modification chaperone [Chloroflexota bacterium]